MEIFNGAYGKRFLCAADNNHALNFMYEIKNGVLQKTGQSPSPSDFRRSELLRYKKQLGKSITYLETAERLHSQNYGIGAYAYIRRVFEGIIEEAHKKAQKEESQWDEEKYTKEKMEGKIKMLKGYLPEKVVTSRKKIYTPLSDGIHNLEDDECMKNYDILFTAVIFILQEWKSKQETEQVFKDLGDL